VFNRWWRTRRRAGERLVDDAEPLGQLEQRGQLILGGVGVEVEAQPDGAEADRGLLAHAEREGAPRQTPGGFDVSEMSARVGKATAHCEKQ
jgi:hypothetical protein